MTREEAIEYNKNLREYMKITDKNSEYKFSQENYEALDMAIKALEQNSEDCVSRQMVTDAVEKTIAKYIPTFIGKYEKMPQEQGWIPCRERLPKEGGWYICTCYNGAINTVTFFKWQTRLKQWEKTGGRAYWKIIAWMPLPEEYKQESEE